MTNIYLSNGGSILNNIFISPVITRASELGVGYYEDSDRQELLTNSSAEEKETLIKTIYRQILGNAYVMESERAIVAESQFQRGELSVRDFIRQVAKSDLYRSRFVDNCPRYRSIELNFKHFLGRAPESYEEMKLHSHILDTQGYEADIDSYLDSDEYQDKFGQNIVPYYRGYKTQTGKSMVGFSHLFKLLRGASGSDKNLVKGNYSRLNGSLISNVPSSFIPLSTATSYGGVTDIQKLLANAIKVNVPSPEEVQIAEEKSAEIASPSLETADQQKAQEQQAKIEQLQQQLSELKLMSEFGSRSLNKWQSMVPPKPETKASQSQVVSPEQEIADLEVQVADAQRLANFADIQLNKWRNKVFK